MCCIQIKESHSSSEITLTYKRRWLEVMNRLPSHRLGQGQNNRSIKGPKTLTPFLQGAQYIKADVMEPNSPFSKTNMQPLGTFTKRGTHVGLLLPSGQVLVNFNDGTSHKVLAQFADALGAELISIPGTWTWTPDSTQAFKKIARRKTS